MRLATFSLAIAASVFFVQTLVVAHAFGQDATIGAMPETVVVGVPESLTAPGASAAREALRRVPGGIGLVEADAFRDGRATTVKDMLDYVPGVFVQPKFGEDSRLSIRGSGLSRNFHLRGIRLLQDGIPINAADGGGDFQEIDPLAFDYVEVFKGANALGYGASFLGGAVNFVTPTGRSATGTVARVEAGSFGTRRLQIANGAHGEKWDAYIAPSYLAGDGFRNQSRQESVRLSSNLGYTFSDAAETRFYLHMNQIDQELPGAVSRASALNDPESAPASNVRNRHKRDIASVRFASRTVIEHGGWATSFGASLAAKRLWHPIFQVIDNDSWDYSGFARSQGDVTALGLRHEITVGVNAIAGTNQARRFVNVGGQRGTLTSDQDEGALNIEIYAEDRWQVRDNLALILGVQYLYTERELDDFFLSNGDQSGKRDFGEVSPRIGLLWRPDPDTDVFWNLSHSAEVAPLAELASSTTVFTTLEPQIAWTAEVGARGSRGDLAYEAAFYRAWIRDELQFFQIAPGLFSIVNADETVHQGLELGGVWTFGRGLAAPGDDARLRLAYTWSDFSFDGDAAFGDNDIPGAPEHFLRSEMRYTHPNGIYFAPNLEWVPEAYFVDNANTLETASYILAGIKAGWDSGRGIRLFLDARNLADRNHIASTSVIAAPTPANQSVFNPGDGRAVYAGVEIRF